MSARAWKTRAAMLAAVLACAGIGGVALAGADDGPQYPTAGGSTFATGLDGWKAKDNTCQEAGLPLPFCSVTNERVDDHQGALRTTFTSLANASEVADGTGGFTSPTFAIPGDASIGSVGLTLSRQLASDAPLVDGAPVADFSVDIVDVTDPAAQTRTRVLDTKLDANDTAWATQSVVVPGGAVAAGRSYQLDVTSRLSSEQAQALQGSVSVLLDDVGVTVVAPVAPVAPRDGAISVTPTSSSKTDTEPCSAWSCSEVIRDVTSSW